VTGRRRDGVAVAEVYAERVSLCSIHSLRLTRASAALLTISRTPKILDPGARTVVVQGIDPKIRVDPKLPSSVGPARAAVLRVLSVTPRPLR
jgi:hypothetical protein